MLLRITFFVWYFAGRMGIVDHDVVELNNLQRQVIFRSIAMCCMHGLLNLMHAVFVK